MVYYYKVKIIGGTPTIFTAQLYVLQWKPKIHVWILSELFKLTNADLEPESCSAAGIDIQAWKHRQKKKSLTKIK